MSILQEVPGNVNKVSAKIIDYLNKRPLKGSVKYRMLNGTKNIDPQAVKGKNDILYPSITQLRLVDKIEDPETNQFVQIGYIKQVDEKGINHTFAEKLIKGSTRGVFVLHEEIPEEAEMYPVIELLSANATNPFRNTNVAPLFERVDIVKEAGETIAKNNKLFRAWKAIDVMEMADKRIFHAANGGNFDDEPDVVNGNLQELAKADPDKFYKMVESPITQIKSMLKQAYDKNIIQYDGQGHRYMWVNGETIISLNRSEGVEPLFQFAEWLQTSKNGGQIQIQIKNLLQPETKKK